MKNLKANSLIGLLVLVIISGCSENIVNPALESKTYSAGKGINDSGEPAFRQEIYLKPGEIKIFDNSNLPFKTFSYFEITNLSNYGNLTCSDINGSIGIFGGYHLFRACLAHMESYYEEESGFGYTNIKIINTSDKVLKLNIYLK